MTLNQLAEEEEDVSVLDEVAKGIEEIKKKLSELKMGTLLSGQYDRNNAIITLHAGAGGTEAQDWVEMLLRMYTRWCEKKGIRLPPLTSWPVTRLDKCQLCLSKGKTHLVI